MGFWQKDVPGHAPKWVSALDLHRARGHEGLRRGRQGGHPRLAGAGGGDRAPSLDVAHRSRRDEPTFALIDIDPGEQTTWEEVLVLARLYRTALEHLGVIGLPKVTGKRGIQIWVPVSRGYRFDETRDWVEQLSRAIGADGAGPRQLGVGQARRARAGRASTSPRTR